MTVGATKEPRTGSKNKTLIPHFQLKNRRKQLHSIEKKKHQFITPLTISSRTKSKASFVKGKNKQTHGQDATKSSAMRLGVGQHAKTDPKTDPNPRRTLIQNGIPIQAGTQVKQDLNPGRTPSQEILNPNRTPSQDGPKAKTDNKPRWTPSQAGTQVKRTPGPPTSGLSQRSHYISQLRFAVRKMITKRIRC